jgi:hypothetical protein
MTTPLKIAWAITVGAIRRVRYAAAPNTMPTLDSTTASPMLPLPRDGSTWATPNSVPWMTIAGTGPIRDRRPRSTTPRKMISSTIGAATTVTITIAIL